MENIVNRVRRLLEIATHPATNVNEAATAAARAQELLFKHKLSMADIEIETGEKEAEAIGRVDLDSASARHAAWKSSLMTALAKGFFCRAIQSMTRNAAGARVARLILVGKPSDTQTLVYLYHYCINEINRLVEEQPDGQGLSFYNSFRLGAVYAIQLAMVAKRAEQEKATAVTETALAIIKRDQHEVDLFVKNNFRTHAVARRGATSNAGWGQGVEAGKTINLGGGGRGLGEASKQIAGR